MRGYVLCKADPQRHARRAETLLRGIADLLRAVGLEVHADLATAGAAGRSLAAAPAAAALADAQAVGAQVAVFFAAQTTAAAYHDVKRTCFQAPAPALAHLVSQWVDLSRLDHNRYAQINIALQLCAKLGHTPYVLADEDLSESRIPSVICGLDVCHLAAGAGCADRGRGAQVHMAAGLRLMRASGEVERAWVCSSPIEGETIPPAVWQAVISDDVCVGREVVVHRDGRFTGAEREFLADYAKRIGVRGGSFGLVEVVKYAAGTPRMYAGEENVPQGVFMRFSDTEGMLTSGSMQGRGTRNPLLVRTVAGAPGAAPPPVEAAAKDIFRLSALSYGSLFLTPRLPTTTKTADKAAYFHASAAGRVRGSRDGSNPEVPVISQGRQQYWL